MVQITIYRCKHCGELIPEGRSDKKYCSLACRQKNYRWRQRQKRYELAAQRNIAELAMYLDYLETAALAAEKLSSTIAYIKAECRKHNVVIKEIK